MNKTVKKNWVYILISVLMCINIIFFIYNNFKKKEKTQSSVQQSSGQQALPLNVAENSEFYDRPCPELLLDTIEGEVIDLKNLIGQVIVLKFSRFYRRDLPNLLFLEHVAGKLKNLGVSLIFINSLGLHYKKEIENICSFTSPIVEDKGTIAGLFNASLEDTIIVDRNFTIKFKYQAFDKNVIYSEVKKWAQNGRDGNQNFSNIDLGDKLRDLSYYDVLDKREKSLFTPNQDKKIIISLFTSICTGCEENTRIQLLKEVSSEVNKEFQTVFLFGFGNNAKAIRQYALFNDWNKFPISIGVIEKINHDQISDYYNLFEFSVDPRTIILDSSGAVLFQEYLKNANSITKTFFRKIR